MKEIATAGCGSSNATRPPRPPGICILTETYYPVIGGGEKQSQSLAEDLSANGFTTIVITRRSDPGFARVERVGRIVVRRVPPAGSGGSRRWLMLVPAFVALVRARRDYDVIFVSGFKALGVAAVLAARLSGKPCVLKSDSNGEMSGEFFAAGLRTLRLTPASWPFRLFLAARNAVLRRASCFVAITSGIAQEYAQHGVSAAAIRQIPNSVDVTRFRPVTPEDKAALRQRLDLPAADVLVTYAGRLVSYKGLPLLLRVVEEIRRGRPDVRLLLIGSGGLDIHNCEAELRAFVAAHRLEDGVRFAGEVPNVYEYLQASDIFVLPSEDDAFPLALVEAMACALPVVSTWVGGIPEIVVDGDTGLLVRAGDEPALHDALVRLIADRSLAAAMGRSGRRVAESRYSREAIAARYIELFLSLRPCAHPAARS